MSPQKKTILASAKRLGRNSCSSYPLLVTCEPAAIYKTICCYWVREIHQLLFAFRPAPASMRKNKNSRKILFSSYTRHYYMSTTVFILQKPKDAGPQAEQSLLHKLRRLPLALRKPCLGNYCKDSLPLANTGFALE